MVTEYDVKSRGAHVALRDYMVDRVPWPAKARPGDHSENGEEELKDEEEKEKDLDDDEEDEEEEEDDDGDDEDEEEIV